MNKRPSANRNPRHYFVYDINLKQGDYLNENISYYVQSTVIKIINFLFSLR